MLILAHASQALSLSKEQERTRQLEIEAQIKQFEAGISENKINERRVAEEERRKTLEYEAQQSKYVRFRWFCCYIVGMCIDYI